jgi:hypothetical protein
LKGDTEKEFSSYKSGDYVAHKGNEVELRVKYLSISEQKRRLRKRKRENSAVFSSKNEKVTKVTILLKK